MPEVQIIKRKDVSEPVTTIVRLLKENTQRFRFSLENMDYFNSVIKVKDLDNGRELRAFQGTGGINFLVGETGWMTTDEQQLLANTIVEIYISNREAERKQKAETERQLWLSDYQDQ